MINGLSNSSANLMVPEPSTVADRNDWPSRVLISQNPPHPQRLTMGRAAAWTCATSWRKPVASLPRSNE